jgi:hypothetical protein
MHNQQTNDCAEVVYRGTSPMTGSEKTEFMKTAESEEEFFSPAGELPLQRHCFKGAVNKLQPVATYQLDGEDVDAKSCEEN